MGFKYNAELYAELYRYSHYSVYLDQKENCSINHYYINFGICYCHGPQMAHVIIRGVRKFLSSIGCTKLQYISL